MSSDQPGIVGLRGRNTWLDSQLVELVASIADEQLERHPDPQEWSLAENLAHIAEFPRYFARQLLEWLDSGRLVMGRVAEHSADRNDAIARAADHTVDGFRKQIDASCASLAGVLARLTDDDLNRPVRNVKYGDEPLADYLRRYVVAHKEAHLTQLQRAIDAAHLAGDGPEPP